MIIPKQFLKYQPEKSVSILNIISVSFKIIWIFLKVTEGLIQPYSSVNLTLVFSPLIPGDISNLFRITFEDKDSDDVNLENIFNKFLD